MDKLHACLFTLQNCLYGALMVTLTHYFTHSLSIVFAKVAQGSSTGERAAGIHWDGSAAGSRTRWSIFHRMKLHYYIL